MAPSSIAAARAHLEGLALQADDDPHGLGVQLHQLAPLVLPPDVHTRGRLRAELQVPWQNLELAAGQGWRRGVRGGRGGTFPSSPGWVFQAPRSPRAW